MHRFPTWHVWRLLHDYQDAERYEILTLMLRAKDPVTWLQIIHNLWSWILLSLSVSLAINFSIAQFPLLIQNYWILNVVSWAILIFINLTILRFALRVLNILRRQHASAQYDLLFILPLNEFALVLAFMRALRYPFDGDIRGKRTGVIFAVVFTLLTLILVFNMRVAFPLNLLQSGTALIGGVYEFVQYLQAFIAVSLVTLLVSQRQRSTQSTVGVVLFAIGQMLFFVLLSTFFGRLAANALGLSAPSPRFNIYIYLWWTTFLQPLLIIFCRELVNFALWRMVKRRLEV